MAKKKDSFEDEMISELSSSFKKRNTDAKASYLWQSTSNVKDYISTGNPILDIILSNKKDGGLPVGRLTEISGGEGAGKTLLAAYILANTQKKGGIAILIDTEHAASIDVFKEVGIDTDKLVYIQAGCVEDVFAAMETIVSKIIATDAGKDKPITIVWDSVAATSTRAEVEGTYDQQTIGMAARIIGKGLRKFIPICSVHNICLVFLNQLRTNIGVSFGDQYVTPGGKSIPYHATIRLRLSHYKQIKDKTTKDLMGREIKCEVKKNKIAPPMRTTYHTIRWGERPGAWFDIGATLWEAGITSGLFTKITAQKYGFTTSTNDKLEFTRKAFNELVKEESFYDELNISLGKKYIITSENAPSLDNAIKEDATGILDD